MVKLVSDTCSFDLFLFTCANWEIGYGLVGYFELGIDSVTQVTQARTSDQADDWTDSGFGQEEEGDFFNSLVRIGLLAVGRKYLIAN